jgi:hypothetical protein
MKKIVIIILSALLPMLSMGQSSLGKTDDLGRIAIAAVVPDEAGIPAGAQKMLQSRLTQVATLNGLGAAEGSQFAMLPMVSIISQDVTPTAPPMISLNMEITLYIVDAKSQAIFSQTSIPLKGVGNTEDRAYTQAINNINPRHGQFRGFVEKGKEKIVEYYNSQCDVIITSAKALAGQKKYDEALATLFNVPDVSRECYDKCMNISVDIYQEYANQQCNEYLSAAKAAWAGKELNKVEENLGKITPDMGCYDEAQQLVATATSAVEAEGGSAWNFKMKRYDDSVDIEKMKIQAGKEVAQSWAYHGAAAHFDWSWMYPGSEKKVVEQPKKETQSEPQKVTEQTTSAPSAEKKPPMGERPKASELVIPMFQSAKVEFDDKIGYEEYYIITSSSSVKTIEGTIRRIYATPPDGFSPLEVIRFYQSFIEGKKGNIIYQTRDPRNVKINEKSLWSYFSKERLSRDGVYQGYYRDMGSSMSEFLVGKIYTDVSELCVVVAAGRVGNTLRFEIVTVEVKP